MQYLCFKMFLMTVLSVFWIDSLAGVNEYVDSIKKNPAALYAFFKTMPKGGELHYHFTGSSYPEELIKRVKIKDYCIDSTTYALTSLQYRCQGESARTLLSRASQYGQAVRAWSRKDFTSDHESKHDHFFSVFGKVYPVYEDFYTSLLADMMRRAASQHELYMEIMMLQLDNTSTYARLIKSSSTLADKKRMLLANQDFNNNITQQVDLAHLYLKKVHQALGCNTNPSQPVCSLQVRFQFFVRREMPLNDVFVQALTGFAAAAQSENIVGINLVQPERGVISSRDFNAQMHIFEFLHTVYPTVNIALHAGELEPKTSSLRDLRFHIRNSVYIGHAKRIGHGVDILHEDKNDETVRYMARKQIAVEINLTSNQVILSVEGKTHPILYYLQHEVPIVLSTDDEGILYTDLTQQYVDAVVTYDLDYPTIKHINRNALTYSFLPGKSIWLDPVKQMLVPACRDRMSQACREFIKSSDKATVQWRLEQDLSQFESKWDHF